MHSATVFLHRSHFVSKCLHVIFLADISHEWRNAELQSPVSRDFRLLLRDIVVCNKSCCRLYTIAGEAQISHFSRNLYVQTVPWIYCSQELYIHMHCICVYIVYVRPNLIKIPHVKVKKNISVYIIYVCVPCC